MAGEATPAEPVPVIPATPPVTPLDRALGLYGPVPETAQPAVATVDGNEPARDFYDPDNPAGDLLQRADAATGAFPRDRLGNVDWVATLAAGLIEPRADRQGRTRSRPLETAILLRDTREMPWVRFPHRQHTEWLDCSNCHPAPFAAQAGANPLSMQAILAGEQCGVCHDRVAFSTFACERCHN
ncbi:MAG TPA: c(7)-type cytochrome triheme domain-containing protein, partial [Gammaproteobacteria bacterium]